MKHSMFGLIVSELFFLRVYLKTPSLRIGSFPVESDFPTSPGSELRLTLMMNQKFLFCQKQLGVATTKELFWLTMGIEIRFFLCVSFNDSTKMSVKEEV